VLDDAVYCHQCGASLELEEQVEGEGAAATIRQRIAGRTASTDTPDDDTERELWQGTFSWKGMIGQMATALLLTLGAAVFAIFFSPNQQVSLWVGGAVLLVWIGLGLLLFYRQISIRYEVTSQRLVHKMGFFFRVTDRIEMIDVDDVRLTEGLVERMFGTGTIYLRSSDRSHPELRLRGIDNARDVARLIDNARRKERIRRGLHIESV
jgi:membrane protein YdbS with pleckstrin-like domain